MIAWKIDGVTTYAIEGYSAVTGSAVQWLRDGIKIIERSDETEALATSVADSNGVYFVPALAGLGAPYWDSFARGMLIGITRGTTREHVVRATLEAIAYLSRDIFDVITEETGVRMQSINIDGGASKNNFLAQFLADVIQATVYRPLSVEATSLGAAQLAGLHTGFWTKADFAHALKIERVFEPQLDGKQADQLYDNWLDAVRRASGWVKIREA